MPFKSTGPQTSESVYDDSTRVGQADRRNAAGGLEPVDSLDQTWTEKEIESPTYAEMRRDRAGAMKFVPAAPVRTTPGAIPPKAKTPGDAILQGLREGKKACEDEAMLQPSSSRVSKKLAVPDSWGPKRKTPLQSK